MRNKVMGVSLALALSLIAGSPVWAGGGDDDGGLYDAAMKAHEDERWEEAAAKFIASFQAGHREEVSAYNAACALARAGKKDQAFAWLEKAYSVGFDLEGYLDDDKDLKSLRADPRWAAFKQKVTKGRATIHEREAQHVLERWNALRARPNAKSGEYDQLGKELMAVGRYMEASAAFLAAAKREENRATSLYNAACALALHGKKEPALALLSQAVEAGYTDAKHMDEDDDLDSLRDDARFKATRALAAELDVPDYPQELGDRKGKVLTEWQAALPRLEISARKHPRLGVAWSNLGTAQLFLGMPDKAVRSFSLAVALGYRRAASSYNLACAHAMAGHKDEAFAWLEKAFAAGFDEPWAIRQDPDLDNIRYDPRFKPYLDRARAREYVQKDKGWKE
jgi:tetratricopeptide (TPR) repeat protein